MFRQVGFGLRGWHGALLITFFAVAGCTPGKIPEQARVPQFSGICGLRISSADNADPTLDVANALRNQNAEFCRWDVKGRSLIAQQVAIEACPPLKSVDGVKAEAFAFASLIDLQDQCGTMGIQVTDLAHFTLRNRLPSHTALCVTWIRRDERPVLFNNGSRVEIFDLGRQLFQHQAIPVFASFVKAESMTIWLVSDPSASHESVVGDIVTAARDYGFDLVQRSCTSEEAAGSDPRVFPQDGSGSPAPTYTFFGADPFGGPAFTIAVSRDGAMMFEGQAVTLAQLQARVDLIKGNEPRPTVVVVGSAGASHRDLAPVMAMIERAGLAKGGVMGP